MMSRIGVFDDVLCLLVEKIEKTALIELGKRLAPVDTAPLKLIKRLARDEEIAVAAPVLSGSRRLSTADLIEIAQTKSHAHLLAISGRATLESRLTDVLLVRGDKQVVSSLAKNAGANFSGIGFSRLVERVEGDDSLIEVVGLRKDLLTTSTYRDCQPTLHRVASSCLFRFGDEGKSSFALQAAKVRRFLARQAVKLYNVAQKKRPPTTTVFRNPIRCFGT
jgi:Uncharacterised protein conserved in bacteria (DUF2336)